ncbi:hypothetical protein THAOC_12501 [Thalassiosira oceanica]|uniref:Uncharacterized protein n=1 Tax=Thalassiosira oceanica TaxID=159749 RepID=K0SMH6_THAOC|nr:hypothetical protein THAOC_12501 [Thalassiosira oceanica]|eukprot:EJK66575.1 hypothetical protein THAOC_12501 [Thalassiosira oceanica]
MSEPLPLPPALHPASSGGSKSDRELVKSQLGSQHRQALVQRRSSAVVASAGATSPSDLDQWTSRFRDAAAAPQRTHPPTWGAGRLETSWLVLFRAFGLGATQQGLTAIHRVAGNGTLAKFYALLVRISILIRTMLVGLFRLARKRRDRRPELAAGVRGSSPRRQADDSQASAPAPAPRP